MNITVATNGYLVEDDNGNLFIAHTLQEAGRLIGEAFEHPANMRTLYAQGSNGNSLIDVHRLAMEGKRIQAVKALRACFKPSLGLREAVDLVDAMTSWRSN